MISNMRKKIRSNFYYKKLEKKDFLKGVKGREKGSLLCVKKLRRKDSSIDLYCRDLMYGSRKKKRGSLYSSSL